MPTRPARPIRTYRKADLAWMDVWRRKHISYPSSYCPDEYTYRYWDGVCVLRWTHGHLMREYHTLEEFALMGYTRVWPACLRLPEGL